MTPDQADAFARKLTTDVVFTREDGSQVLVTRWVDGSWTLAERPRADWTWGPRTTGSEER